jgi:tetratricopeptide (TPR) repeat protein
MTSPRSDRELSEARATTAGEREREREREPLTDRHARSLIARIQKNWNDVEAIRGLAAHYGSAGDYPSLANLMEGWGDALEDPRAAADAYVEAADALLMAARPGSEACALYERALSRDPSHPQALDRLTRVLEESNNFDRLKQVLKYVAHQLTEQGGSQQLLASVHYRLGLVYEKHFDEPRKAATLYRRAIEENPRLVSAIAAARRLYTDQGNHSTVGVLYEFEIEATPNAEDKHALLLALARHKREQCDDLDGAVLAFRRAAKLVPASVRALSGLAETLLARSERAEHLASDADRQRAAEVFFHLAQRVPRAEAVSYLQRALLVVPGHAGARVLLENLSRASHVPPPSAAQPRLEGDRAAAAAWLNEGDLEPVVDELGSGDLLPVDDASIVAGTHSSSMPPPFTLQSARAPVAAPRAHVQQQPAPRPASRLSSLPDVAGPPGAPPHPKIVAALPDEIGRVPLEVNIGSTTDSNFYVEASDELLDGGVFVATYTPLPVGTQAGLTITLPGKLIARAHGRVVLTRDLMDAFDDHIPGMCVEFERVDPKSLALIQRFSRKRAPTFIEF